MIFTSCVNWAFQFCIQYSLFLQLYSLCFYFVYKHLIKKWKFLKILRNIGKIVCERFNNTKFTLCLLPISYIILWLVLWDCFFFFFFDNRLVYIYVFVIDVKNIIFFYLLSICILRSNEKFKNSQLYINVEKKHDDTDQHNRFFDDKLWYYLRVCRAIKQ